MQKIKYEETKEIMGETIEDIQQQQKFKDNEISSSAVEETFARKRHRKKRRNRSEVNGERDGLTRRLNKSLKIPRTY